LHVSYFVSLKTFSREINTTLHGDAFVDDRDNKELKGKQAKQSVEAVKSVTADKTIKNRAERDR